MIVLFVIATLLSLVHGETNDKKRRVKQLENEVLIKKVGVLLPRAENAHAIVKLNISQLVFEAQLTCQGVTMIDMFVEEILRDVTAKQTRKDIVTNVKPLIINLNHTCTYIRSQVNSLVHTFEAHEINIEAKKLAKENLRDNSKPGHNINKRQIGTIVVSSILGSISSSAFTAIFDAITGASNKEAI